MFTCLFSGGYVKKLNRRNAHPVPARRNDTMRSLTSALLHITVKALTATHRASVTRAPPQQSLPTGYCSTSKIGILLQHPDISLECDLSETARNDMLSCHLQ